MAVPIGNHANALAITQGPQYGPANANAALVDLTQDDDDNEGRQMVHIGGGMYLSWNYANFGGVALAENIRVTGGGALRQPIDLSANDDTPANNALVIYNPANIGGAAGDAAGGAHTDDLIDLTEDNDSGADQPQPQP